MNASHTEQMCLLRCMCCTNWYLFLLRAQHWIHGVVYLSKPNGKIIVRAHVCASSTVVTVTTTGAWNTKNCKNPLLYHICSLANDFAVSSFDWLKIAYFNFHFRIIAMANFFYRSINCLKFGFRAISQFYAMEFIWNRYTFCRSCRSYPIVWTHDFWQLCWEWVRCCLYVLIGGRTWNNLASLFNEINWKIKAFSVGKVSIFSIAEYFLTFRIINCTASNCWMDSDCFYCRHLNWQYK